MTETLFAIPGDLDSPTGGYGYDRQVLRLLPSFGVSIRHVALPGSFPSPSAADLETTRKLLAASPASATLLIDGLAYGAFPADLAADLDRRIIALVHHPLALETGLTPARSAALKASESAALGKVQRVVVTSAMTKSTLVSDFAVPADKITVAEPGTDPAVRASGTGMPMQLLAVGTVLPRKGYEGLIAALVPLRETDWRLSIAGALDRDPATVARLKALIELHGLEDRITLHGVVVPATLDRLYDSADLFVMPSLYEGYGMVLAEAMARGLPIICTTGGAAAQTVPDAAAVKVPPGDVDALSQGLAALLADRKLRARLADRSWEAGRQLPTWNETARRVAAAILDLKI
ncbi:MAG: glycosyltransferase family 4 protein [Hyphomicrobiaceae bacterium]|nr:glycosyltransferase family 4 protein [Hyphomicrobiaceae bacterium]